MVKRNLFEELQEGLEDVKAFEAKKITLKTTNIELKKRKISRDIEIKLSILRD